MSLLNNRSSHNFATTLSATALTGLFAIAAPATAQTITGSADLDQIRNGSAGGPNNPVQWTNGDAGASNSHFLEGYSMAYRMKMTGLSLGQHTLIIQWDVTKNGKHAFDYITNYNRLQPHGFFGHAAETINPLDGLGAGYGAPTTFQIPPPPSNGSPVPGMPTNSFNALPAADQLMTIWNGTITSITYPANQPPATGSNSNSATITFTATSDKAVIAWGAHIASQVDWGVGTSAASISGSPYHTSLISLDGGGGSQDRGMKSDAVVQPPTCNISGDFNVCPSSTNHYCATVGSATYSWSVSGCAGAAIVGSSTGQCVDVHACNSCGSFTLSLTISGAGGPSTCNQIVQVQDSERPVISNCPQDITLQCGDAIPPCAQNVSANDVCSGPITVNCSTGTLVPGNCPGTGVITRTYTATDPCNNTATCTQLITILDTTPPSIQCPPAISAQCTAPPPAQNLSGFITLGGSASDNCSGPVTVAWVSDSNPSGSCPATITRTYRATDACGNHADCTQTITLNDTTAPTFSVCPGPLSFQCASQVPPCVASNATAIDNCGSATVTCLADSNNGGSGCANSPLVITRTSRATDPCGNPADWVPTIPAGEKLPPTNNCPQPISAQCTATPPATNLQQFIALGGSTSDNCGGAVTVTFVLDSPPTGNCPKVVSRIYRATDSCGNFAVCTQLITINDTTAPTFSNCPGPLSFQCASQVPPCVASNATAIDNCGTPTVTCLADTNNGGAGCQNNPLVITRTYRATDGCGNHTDCTQRLTVIDTTPPQITTCPPDLHLECNEPVPPCNPGDVVATDVCGGKVTVTCATGPGAGAGGGCQNGGGFTYVYTATDSCGNSTTCTQHVFVNDTSAPVFNCPENKTIPCHQSAGFDEPTATDNCDPNPQITVVSTVSNEVECPVVSSLTRTWKATDACGNTSFCSQTINKVDHDPPLILCLHDLDVDCPSEIPAPCETVQDFTFCCGSVLDVCDDHPTLSWQGDVIEGGGDGKGNSCSYTILRTYRATDHCGNFSECTERITVHDDIKPVISGVSDVTGCTGVPLVLPTPTVTDNCDTKLSVNCSRSDGLPCSDPFPAGNTTVTYTASDSCGNAANPVSITVRMDECAQFCAQTMMQWGSMTSPNDSNMMQTLLSAAYGGDLYVGRTDGASPRSVKIKAAANQCLPARLPSGTNVAALPDGLGNATLTNGGCNTSPVAIPLNNAGKFKNNLLGQTIALALNVRYDKLMGPGNLESLQLQPMMTTVDSGGVVHTWNLSASVLNALPNGTVKDLLKLANKGLAGREISPVTLNKLNSTLDKVNGMFNGCAYLVPSSKSAGGGAHMLAGGNTTNTGTDIGDVGNPGNSHPGTGHTPGTGTPGATGSHSNGGTVLTDGVNDDAFNIARLGGSVLVKGDYTQLSEALLYIELRGDRPGQTAAYDVLHVEGDAQLGGTLVVRIRKDFRPEVGDRFEIITAQSIRGTFDNLDLQPISSGPEVLDVQYGAATVTLIVKPHADIVGDLNHDGQVDTLDLSALLADWNKSNSPADLNHDGKVDALDMAMLLGNWGKKFD